MTFSQYVKCVTAITVPWGNCWLDKACLKSFLDLNLLGCISENVAV